MHWDCALCSTTGLALPALIILTYGMDSWDARIEISAGPPLNVWCLLLRFQSTLHETKTKAWDWFRRKNRGQQPLRWRVLRRQRAQVWVHPHREGVCSHTELARTCHPLLLAFKGEQYVPGIQMPRVNRKEALMDGRATMRNGSMYHLTWYWHILPQKGGTAEVLEYGLGLRLWDIPPRIRGWQPLLSWSCLHQR